MYTCRSSNTSQIESRADKKAYFGLKNGEMFLDIH